MPAGRPLSLTDEKIARIINALRNRNVLEASGAMAGVKRSTLYDALRRGRAVSDALEDGAGLDEFTENDLFLGRFSDAVTRAVAEAEVHTVALIAKAGQEPSIETTRKRRYVGLDGDHNPVYADEVTTVERPPDWKALGWIADRRWTDWAPRQRTELSGRDGGPIPIEHRIESILTRVSELRAGEVIDVPPGDG